MKFLPVFLTFSLVICLHSSLLAQKTVVQGYYVDNNGDTVRGTFPGYREWNRNPSEVEFIPSLSKRQIQLNPENCVKFVIDGYDEYISFQGDRLLNLIDDRLLRESFSSDTTDKFENVKTFLRLVSRTEGGELYMLHDRKRENYFFRISGGQISELKYKKSVDVNKLREHPEFRRQINNMFAHMVLQKNLVDELNELPYTEKTLIAFFEILFPPTRITDPKKKKLYASWVVSGGLVWNIVSEQNRSVDPVPITSNTSYSPFISFGRYFPGDRNFGRYFFYPQLKAFRYKNTNEHEDGIFINSTTYQAQAVLAIQLDGGFNLINNRNKQLYFSGGVGTFLQMGAKQTKQVYLKSDRSAYGGPAENKLHGITYLIDVSSGIVLNKKLMFILGYQVPTSIGEFGYVPRLSGFRIGAGYRWN